MEIEKIKVGFYKYIKNFARGGFIIGSISALFLILRAVFGGEVGFILGDYTFTGVSGALLIVLFVPVFMMLVWVFIGIVSFIVSRLFSLLFNL